MQTHDREMMVATGPDGNPRPFFPIAGLEVDDLYLPAELLDALRPEDFTIHDGKITVRLLVRKSVRIHYGQRGAL